MNEGSIEPFYPCTRTLCGSWESGTENRPRRNRRQHCCSLLLVWCRACRVCVCVCCCWCIVVVVVVVKNTSLPSSIHIVAVPHHHAPHPIDSNSPRADKLLSRRTETSGCISNRFEGSPNPCPHPLRSTRSNQPKLAYLFSCTRRAVIDL